MQNVLVDDRRIWVDLCAFHITVLIALELTTPAAPNQLHATTRSGPTISAVVPEVASADAEGVAVGAGEVEAGAALVVEMTSKLQGGIATPMEIETTNTGWCSTFPGAEVMGMIDRGNGVAAQHEVMTGIGIGIISAASAQDPRDGMSDGNGEGVEVGTMTGIDVGGTTGTGDTSVASGSV